MYHIQYDSNVKLKQLEQYFSNVSKLNKSEITLKSEKLDP